MRKGEVKDAGLLVARTSSYHRWVSFVVVTTISGVVALPILNEPLGSNVLAFAIGFAAGALLWWHELGLNVHELRVTNDAIVLKRTERSRKSWPSTP